MASKTDVFVPPQNIRVRLINFKNQRALSAKEKLSGFGLAPTSDQSEDQWFYVIPVGEDKPSYYRFQHISTGGYLYGAFGRTILLDFDGQVHGADGTAISVANLKDFHLERGAGSRAGAFRLKNDVDFLRSPVYPEKHSADQWGDIDPSPNSVWFSFGYDLDDFEFESINFHIDEKKIIGSELVYISTQIVHNELSERQDITENISDTIEEQRTFSNELGASLGLSVTGSIGFPVIGESKVSVSAKISTSFTWGSAHTTKRSFTRVVQVHIGPGKVYKIVTSAIQAQVEIPITVIWTSLSTGQELKVRGTYTGVTHYNFETTYKEDEGHQDLLQ